MAFATLDRRLAVAAFFIGTGTVLIAIGLGWSDGGMPSITAYQQQVTYLIGIPLIGILILGRETLSRAIWAAIAIAVVALFLWSAQLAAWQFGVALGLWPDGRLCASNGVDIDLSGLLAQPDPNSRPCGLYSTDLWGLPLPLLNMIVATGLASLVGMGLVRRVTRGLHRVRRH